jgi:hypothetical protein
MSRRRILVLDGPLAGKWVPDYGQTANLLEVWDVESVTRSIFWWMEPPVGYVYHKRLYVARLDGVVYVREGYSLWPLDPHVPHVAILAITAEALLSS